MLEGGGSVPCWRWPLKRGVQSLGLGAVDDLGRGGCGWDGDGC
jgi:hypothetical protein